MYVNPIRVLLTRMYILWIRACHVAGHVITCLERVVTCTIGSEHTKHQLGSTKWVEVSNIRMLLTEELVVVRGFVARVLFVIITVLLCSFNNNPPPARVLSLEQALVLTIM